MRRTPIEIASLARVHTRKALKTLVGVMNDPGASHSARVAAAEALLDRGWDNATWEAEAEALKALEPPGKALDPPGKVQ